MRGCFSREKCAIFFIGVCGPFISLLQAIEPVGGYATKSVTHTVVIFQAARHYRVLAGIQLHCVVTEAHVCERLFQSRHVKFNVRDLNPRSLDYKFTLRHSSRELQKYARYRAVVGFSGFGISKYLVTAILQN